MIKIECPKCNSKNINCCDTDFDLYNGIHWDLCYCEDCDASFSIKYIAVDIEEEDD